MNRSRFPRCFAILFGLTFFFLSCEKEKDENIIASDELYAHYYLFYNAKTDTTQAGVVFCKGGKCGGNESLLSPKESIKFNTETLNIENKEYAKRFKGFLPSGTFVWKTSDGRTFTNQIQLEPIAFSPNLDTINRTQDLQLNWVGKPVQTLESVVLIFYNIVKPYGLSEFFAETPGTQSLIVPTTELKKIETIEKKELILDRRKFVPLQQGGRTGGILASFYRDYKNVVFE